ncbi:methionyl-tRNA formyltransferase [Virgibacillus natechei]|uniref:Methionyl-tRNA formyltransferase n=1 Tax=Virgibacillus natechei TaxID=1216297 RepID=A0ABS4ICT8_9BACI|nr:methionyl-tRNA formyltransferase [Virgibacillus natechei]MBP1968151.1 methionyl-tRNA formyltransferase [Virgibacillus natechei]UZD14572.1 methionyl-tRNA formyltransferase [Virgibacillus natechei]
MKRIVFMGTPDFSVPILQKLVESEYDVVLVVTQPDRPKGRKRVITPSPVKSEAEKQHIPVFQPEKLREDYAEILAYKPDLIVTAAYGQILPNALLENPEYGCINVHASILPELRGGAPIHYAIMQGKQETGITIMYMDEKLDAGDILTQRTVSIAENDHVGTLHNKLSEAGADLLIETIPKLAASEIAPIKQDDTKATFATNIKREQEKIDWAKSNLEIYNHIRGLHPWPVAFTTYQGKGMKIWWAEIDDREYEGTPGEIVQKETNDAFIVICGNQKGVRITEIQPAGKKRMRVNDYLRGADDRIKIGEVMGGSYE